MGKKKTTVIGSEQEEALKAKKAVQLEQKKLREGKSVAKAAPVKEAAVEEVVVKAPKLSESETGFVDIVKRQAEAARADAHSKSSSDTTEEGTTKKANSKIRSKAYKTAKNLVGSEKLYSLSEGISMLRKVSLTKFDPTVELHINLKKTPANKLSVNLPHTFGAAKKVVIATDEVVAQIEAGQIDFDVLVSTPAQMVKLVKFAKVLGPKGLMPNPKNGTVSEKPEEAVKKLSSDQSLALKLDKSGPVLHVAIGKLSFSDSQLQDNINAVLGTSSNNLKKIVLKSSMSPAVRISVV